MTTVKPHLTESLCLLLCGSNFSPSPRRLREEFDNEENETRGEVGGSRNEVPSNEEIELRRLAITAADNSDVNIYQDIDNPDDFTAMVSDAENDDGTSGDEECVEEETN
ncbi:hypothetical protein F441_22429 [Phytophthora nicotianae CJ01A1]|uniref:Uncharacterized protein n=1 Tax=Phytophthora nicotianae CJ01A1 TaxID=1317063 RepID=W2VR60_PHYNI|nr:hypothetical protein F441_22429 [Phytophthora nicotianae CJ01A1]